MPSKFDMHPRANFPKPGAAGQTVLAGIPALPAMAPGSVVAGDGDGPTRNSAPLNGQYTPFDPESDDEAFLLPAAEALGLAPEDRQSYNRLPHSGYDPEPEDLPGYDRGEPELASQQPGAYGRPWDQGVYDAPLAAAPVFYTSPGAGWGTEAFDPATQSEQEGEDEQTHVYQTSQEDLRPSDHDYGEGVEGAPPEDLPPEEPSYDIRVDHDDSFEARRRASGEPGSVTRKLAPYAIAAVFCVIGAGVLYFSLSPIVKAVFGGRGTRAPYVDVQATTIKPHAPTVPVLPQSMPSQPGPAPRPADYPAAALQYPDASQMPGAPVPSQSTATQLVGPQPVASATTPVVTSQIVNLQKQIESMQSQLAASENSLKDEDAKLQAIQSSDQLATDKASASITLLENTVVSLQSSLSNLEQSSKPAETAALPVPSSDTNDADANEVLQGYDLRGTSATAAVVKTPTGMATYQLGQEIPGAGTATGWKQWDGTWELLTTAGIIRPAMTSN